MKNNCRLFLFIILLIAGSNIHAGPIHIHAQKGSLVGVKKQLESDKKLLNKPDEDKGKTPLHWACDKGHIKVAEYLLAKGADVNMQTASNWRAIHYAVRSGKLNIVKELIKNDALLNVQTNTDKSTPFHVAVIYKRKTVLEWLLKQKKINLLLKDSNGHTPFQCAIHHHRTELLECFSQSRGTEPILHSGMDKGTSVKRLPRRLKPTGTTSTSHKPGSNVWSAIKKGDINIVKRTLRVNKALINSSNVQGETLLHVASKTCNGEMLNILIKCGADSKAVDTKGNTPFHLAAMHGNFSALSYFCSKEIFVFNVNNKDFSPLALAVKNDHFDCVKELLDHGALVTSSIYKLAKKSQMKKLLNKHFVEQGPTNRMIDTIALTKITHPLNKELMHAISANNFKKFKKLINDGTTIVTGVDRDNNNLMHLILKSSHPTKFFGILIGLSKTSRVFEQGKNLLKGLISSSRGQKAVRVLKKAPKKIMKIGIFGGMYLAAEAVRKGAGEDVVRLMNKIADEILLPNPFAFTKTKLPKGYKKPLVGISLDGKNNEGKTALHLAMEKQEIVIAHILARLGAKSDLRDMDGRLPSYWACNEFQAMFLRQPVSFDTIFGMDSQVDQVKALMKSYMENIRTKLRFSSKSAIRNESKSKLVLFHGPSGTGKSMLARAAVNMMEYHWVTRDVDQSELKFIVRNEMRPIDELFTQARVRSPSVVYINEYSDDELVSIFYHMKEISATDDIIVIISSQNIDHPLLKKHLNNFDAVIKLSSPSEYGRKKILHSIVDELLPSTNVSPQMLAQIAFKTEGFSGGDLKNLVYVAAVHAQEMDREKVASINLDYAFDVQKKLRDEQQSTINTAGINQNDAIIKLNHEVLAKYGAEIKCAQTKQELIKQVKKRKYSSSNDSNGRSIMHWASIYNDEATLETLMKKHSSFATHTDKWGNNSVHCVAMSKNKSASTLRLFASHDGLFQDANSRGFTAAHIAVHHNNPNILEKILDFGGKINSGEEIYGSPIHWAAVLGRISCLKILLNAKYKADVNMLNDRNETPIYLVARRAEPTVGKRTEAELKQLKTTMLMLLKLGANPTIRDQRGRHADYWLRKYGHHDMRKLMFPMAFSCGLRHLIGLNRLKEQLKNISHKSMENDCLYYADQCKTLFVRGLKGVGKRSMIDAFNKQNCIRAISLDDPSGSGIHKAFKRAQSEKAQMIVVDNIDRLENKEQLAHEIDDAFDLMVVVTSHNSKRSIPKAFMDGQSVDILLPTQGMRKSVLKAQLNLCPALICSPYESTDALAQYLAEITNGYTQGGLARLIKRASMNAMKRGRKNSPDSYDAKVAGVIVNDIQELIGTN